MSYSDSYPSVSPTWQCNFSANGGRIDPRASYTRSTTGTFYGKNKHLSSDNLLLQSSDFDTTWTTQGLTSITGGQTDPSGGTDGFTIVENTATSFHRVDQSMSASGELAFVVYAKRKSGTRYLNLALYTPANSQSAGLATFDLSGGSTHTSNGSSSTLTNLSATQTASGNGYYKCVFKATGSGPTYVSIGLSDVAAPVANNYGLVLYTGDGTSSIDIAFASLSTTGATDYNATTTQIHREYAPTLQTAAINAPRFEHSATDGESAGTSLGILIEGSSTNIIERSSEFGNVYWGKINSSVIDNAAIAPDGTLTADLIVEASETSPTTNSHYAYRPSITPAASTSYTYSLYLKAAGRNNALLFTSIGGVSGFCNFNLSNGTVATTSGAVVGAISSVSNGWYRCSINWTTTSTASGIVSVYTANSDSTFDYTGNGYSGILCWGAQVEAGHLSSLISTSGSAVTRASDSLSVALSAINQNPIGNAVSAVAEFDTNANDAQFRRVMVLKSVDTGLRIDAQAYSGIGYVFVANTSGGTTELTSKSGITNGFHKVAIGLDGTTANASFDGATASTMSNADTASVQFDTLQIGSYSASLLQIEGHIRNVSLYNVGLSATNVSALTK